MEVWLSLALAVIVGLIIPGIVLMIRGAIKWTRVETKLDAIVEDMKDLVKDKDKVHLLLMEQMKEDRKATDTRLRWLEMHLWKRNGERGASNAV